VSLYPMSSRGFGQRTMEKKIEDNWGQVEGGGGKEKVPEQFPEPSLQSREIIGGVGKQGVSSPPDGGNSEKGKGK